MAHIRKRTLSDGSTAFRVVWDDATGRRHSRQFSKATGPRPAEAAKDFKVRLEDELRRGTYVDPRAGDLTFHEFAEQWRAAAVHRASTADRVERTLRLHVYPQLGHLRLGAIRHPELRRFAQHLSVTPVEHERRKAAQPLAPRTIKVVLDVVRSVFSAAVAERVLPESPYRRDVLPPPPPPAEVVIPTVDQVREIAEAMPARYRALILLAAGTGLRSAELRGLDVARVRFLEREVVVDRQLSVATVANHGVAVYSPPKSRSAYRRVPLSPTYAEVVSIHLARFGTGPAGLIFRNAADKPLIQQAVAVVLTPILRRMGFPEQTGMHLFRHFYASALIAQGVDLLTVARYLGHATTHEVEKTYGHLWHDHMDRARQAIDAGFPAVVPGVGEALSGRPGPSQGAAVESARRLNTHGHVTELRPATRRSS